MSLTIAQRPSLQPASLLPSSSATPAPQRGAPSASPDAFASPTQARALVDLGKPSGTPVRSILDVVSGAGVPPASSLVVPQVELDPGAQGPEVQHLQECLVSLSYLSPEKFATGPGIYGPATTQAMKDFQAAAGLEQLGRYGPGSRAAMTAAVGHLPTVDSIIDNAYRGLLQREPDDGGKISWRRGLTEATFRGASDDQLRQIIDAGIKASPEYQQKHPPGGTPDQRITDLFKQLLQRDPDSGAMTHFRNEWSQLAAQGKSVGEIEQIIRNEITASPEYNVKQMVNGLYRELLSRESDPVGRESWTTYGLNRLSQGADMNQVRSEITSAIMGSEEYKRLHPDGEIPGAQTAINFALNPGRNPMSGDGNWYFWCLGLVNLAYQNAGRRIPELQAGSAMEAYQQYKAEGKIHLDDRIPPKGALVFYDTFQNFGHIGISMGDGRIVNTFESGTPQTGTRGLHDLPNYLGWCYP